MSPILEDFNDVSAGCIQKKVTPLIKANGQTSILIHSKKENIVFVLLFENYKLGCSAPVITMHSAGTNIHESELQTISYERNILLS
jgi:hypothetical protein